MCVGNRAESSARFINAQLSAHYENAKRCSEKQDLSKRPLSTAVEHGACLYDYSMSKNSASNDVLFSAQFDMPKLEFICNHDVILFLGLIKGSFVVDTGNKKATSRSSSVTIDGLTIAIRISYCVPPVDSFKCEVIGKSEYASNIIVLDYTSASSIILERSNLPGIFDKGAISDETKFKALSAYVLRSYLPLLKRAGFHVFFSLPHFDILQNSSFYIDYTANDGYTLLEDRIRGISVEEVNNYLQNLWHQADSIDVEEISDGDILAQSNYFLAKYKTIHNVTFGYDVASVGIDMVFGPLTVKPICQYEVLVMVDLQEVLFYKNDFTGEPDTQFSDWKLAFVVDIDSGEHEEIIAFTSLKLTHTSRFCETSSTFSVTEHDEEGIVVKYKSVIVDFMTEEYFVMLSRTGNSCIYDHRIHQEEASHRDEDLDNDETEEWCEMVINESKQTQCSIPSGFDIVTAITQYSINTEFQARWDKASAFLAKGPGRKDIADVTSSTCVAKYSYESEGAIAFEASFSSPKIQLLCEEGSNRAVLFLVMDEGRFTTLKGKNAQSQFSFKDWRVAFDVQLRLLSAASVTQENPASPTSRQFVIDMKSATLNMQRSRVPGLLEGSNADKLDYRQIRSRRESLIFYVRKHYLLEFEQARLHELLSIPIAASGDSTNMDVLSPSTVKFQIIPFTFGNGNLEYINGCFGSRRLVAERNMVVFMGVLGEHQLPSFDLPRSTNWVGWLNREHPLGTICLSRESFLHARILHALSIINKQTTIVPSFTGVDSGRWFVKLTTIANHETLKDQECRWRTSESSNNAAGERVPTLDFDWKIREEWRYVHEREDMNGQYTIDCITRNTISIPTVEADRCIIPVKGRVEITLSFSKLVNQTADSQSQEKIWHTKMQVSWAVNVILLSNPYGFQIALSPRTMTPHPKKDPITYSEAFRNTKDTKIDVGDAAQRTTDLVFEEFKHEFPSTLELSELIQVEDLSRCLQGSWDGLFSAYDITAATTFFNQNGDFFVDVCTKSPEPQGRSGYNGRKDAFNGARSMGAGFSPPITPSSPSYSTASRPQSPIGDESGFSSEEDFSHGSFIRRKHGWGSLPRLSIGGKPTSPARVSGESSSTSEHAIFSRRGTHLRAQGISRQTNRTSNGTGVTRTSGMGLSPRTSSPSRAPSPAKPRVPRPK